MRGAAGRKIDRGEGVSHANFVVCNKPGIVVGAEVGAGNSNTQPSTFIFGNGGNGRQFELRGREMGHGSRETH